jgi:hypothetical protein
MTQNNNKLNRINTTQDSISKQGAVDRATEIALNPIWRKATDIEKQQILGDISLIGKYLYFEKNLLPTTEDYKMLYNLDNIKK